MARRYLLLKPQARHVLRRPTTIAVAGVVAQAAVAVAVGRPAADRLNRQPA
jgi:hypothetical protein